jgi:hypothetical protein
MSDQCTIGPKPYDSCKSMAEVKTIYIGMYKENMELKMQLEAMKAKEE